MTTTTTEPYRVCKTGTHIYYVQEVATGELKGLDFKTRRAATEAVAGWNSRRAGK